MEVTAPEFSELHLCLFFLKDKQLKVISMVKR